MSQKEEDLETVEEYLTLGEAREKVKDLIETSKQSLRQFAIPVEVFLKSIQGNDKCSWSEMRKTDDLIKQMDLLILQREKENSPIVKDLKKALFDMTKNLYPIILMDKDQELYGIYAQGVNISKLKTVGGKVFKEVAEAAGKMGIYNPMRNNIGKNV